MRLILVPCRWATHLLILGMGLGVLPSAQAIAEDIRVADDGLFERLDTNGDGRVVVSDVAPEHARLFARLLRLGDENNDQALTVDEWRAALEPRRPPKPIEAKQSAERPGADATRLLLLMLDADGDGRLTREEVSGDLQRVFDQLVERLDRNEDGRLNRLELSRGGPQLTRLATRAVRGLDLNVERELKRLEREQGAAAKRFDEQPTPQQRMADPERARALFQEFDANKDGQGGQTDAIRKQYR